MQPRPQVLPRLRVLPLRGGLLATSPLPVRLVTATPTTACPSSVPRPTRNASHIVPVFATLRSQDLDAVGMPAEAVPRFFVVPYVAVVKCNL